MPPKRKATDAAEEPKAKKSSQVTIPPDEHAISQKAGLTVHDDFAYLANQVDITGANNNNKYYRGQVLKSSASGPFYAWTRWGRVGETGQNKLEQCGGVDQAISSFEKKFKDKTGHAWAGNGADYPSKGKGKYTVIHESYGGASQAAALQSASPVKEAAAPVQYAKPTITGKLADFVNLVTDQDMFKSQLQTLGVDTAKMPLGDISKKTVDDGFKALLDVEAHLKSGKPNPTTLAQLCSVFYTYIPHAFGRQKAPVLTLEDIQTKKDMLNVLSDVGAAVSEQATKAKGKGKGKGGKAKVEVVPAPIDTKYESLGAELRHVDPKSDEFKRIVAYTANTQGYRSCTVEEVFAVAKEDDGFDKKLGNRKLLWHGTNVAVVAAILKSGLRIMPHSGGRVGSGIYLASENGKSAGYVRTHGSTGIMFLCEAALGKQRFVNKDGMVSWNEKDPVSAHGCDSVLAVGRTEPDPAADVSVALDGKQVVMPQGKVGPNAHDGASSSSFAQSEYLVYKESQVRIRYVLKMKF